MLQIPADFGTRGTGPMHYLACPNPGHFLQRGQLGISFPWQAVAQSRTQSPLVTRQECMSKGQEEGETQTFPGENRGPF